MVKFLVTGDRYWPEDHIMPIWQVMVTLPMGCTIIHGCARGVDTIAGQLARSLHFQVREYPARWDLYGRAAGPIRNKQMLDENPDIESVLVFHDNLATSKGTANMIEQAEARGIDVQVYDSK